MKNTIIILFLLIINKTILFSQNNEINIQEIFKEIDIERHTSAIKSLLSEDKKLKDETIDSITNNPNYYNPPVLYALSKVFFNQDKKGEAAYWFYFAQLRARIDANICLDNTAKKEVSILDNIYAPEIIKYSFQDIEKLEITIKKVVDFIRTNDENYDHRWINLHGMLAFSLGFDKDLENVGLSEPKEKWEDIKKETVDTYYNDFIEYVVKRK